MRKTIAAVALLALALLAGGLSFGSEVNFEAVSATTTSKTVVTNAGSVVVINDGADIVYVRVFDPGTAPEAATSADIQVKSGESFEFATVGSISVVAASATATVRVLWR